MFPNYGIRFERFGNPLQNIFCLYLQEVPSSFGNLATDLEEIVQFFVIPIMYSSNTVEKQHRSLQK